MNGTKKVEDILSDVRIPFSAVPDADRNGKDISNLSQEEIALFKI